MSPCTCHQLIPICPFIKLEFSWRKSYGRLQTRSHLLWILLHCIKFDWSIVCPLHNLTVVRWLARCYHLKLRCCKITIFLPICNKSKTSCCYSFARICDWQSCWSGRWWWIRGENLDRLQHLPWYLTFLKSICWIEDAYICMTCFDWNRP